jgi:OmpA-OmpF porin, OOP family
MMKRNVLTVLVPGLLLGMFTCANAGVTAQSWSVSPYGGGTSFLNGQGLDTSATIGVRGGYNFTNHFGIEAVADYTNADGKVSHGADVHVYNWHLDALYNFMPEKRWVPYAVVGWGWQNRTYPSDNHNTRVGLNYGGGVKFFAQPSLAVRLDLRDLVMRHHDNFYHDLQYTAGVDIYFGGVKPAPTAAPAAAVPSPPPAPPIAPTPPPAESATPAEPEAAAPAPEVAAPAPEAAAPAAPEPARPVVTPPPAPTTPPPAPVAPPVQPAQPQAKVMTFGALAMFDVDQAKVKPQGKKQLKEYREKAQAELDRTDKIIVTGYTDNTGSAEHNLELSKRRAEAVRDYLVSQGVDKGKIEVRGEGENNPVADNATAAGRAKNRRVEIEVQGVEK